MISILPESNYAAIMTETVEPYLDSRPAPSSSCTATRNPPRNSAK